MKPINLKTVFAALAGGLLMAGCGGSGGGGSGSTTDSTGTASFGVTDAPAEDLENVYITFNRLEVNPEDGDPRMIELDQPRQIDLLTLQGANAEALVEDVELEAGNYEWVRLYIDVGCASSGSCDDSEGSTDSFVVESGTGGQFGLFVPGSQPQSQNPNQRFVQLSSGFTIAAGSNVDFTIDVELNKALVKINHPNFGDYYMLRPSLRIVNNIETDHIKGDVAAELTTKAHCSDDSGETVTAGNAVYLYSGFDASPGDVNLTAASTAEGDDPQPDHDSDNTDGNADEVNPIAVAMASDDDNDGALEYEIGFVAAGEYTVAFTCEGERDESETDEDIQFQAAANVEVTADNDPETVNFDSDGSVSGDIEGEVTLTTDSGSGS